MGHRTSQRTYQKTPGAAPPLLLMDVRRHQRVRRLLRRHHTLCVARPPRGDAREARALRDTRRVRDRHGGAQRGHRGAFRHAEDARRRQGRLAQARRGRRHRPRAHDVFLTRRPLEQALSRISLAGRIGPGRTRMATCPRSSRPLCVPARPGGGRDPDGPRRLRVPLMRWRRRSYHCSVMLV